MGNDMTYEEARALLGVRDGATDDEIEAAFRRIVRTSHPDALAGLPPEQVTAGERRFKEASRAKSVLRQHIGEASARPVPQTRPAGRAPVAQGRHVTYARKPAPDWGNIGTAVVDDHLSPEARERRRQERIRLANETYEYDEEAWARAGEEPPVEYEEPEDIDWGDVERDGSPRPVQMPVAGAPSRMDDIVDYGIRRGSFGALAGGAAFIAFLAMALLLAGRLVAIAGLVSVAAATFGYLLASSTRGWQPNVVAFLLGMAAASSGAAMCVIGLVR